MQDVVLEPISTGDIIDRAVRLYRQNFTTFVLIVALSNVVQFTGNLMVTYGSVSNLANPNAFSPITIIFFIFGYLLIGIVNPFIIFMMYAGLVRVSADHIMLGTPITLSATVKLVKGRIGQLILGAILLLVLTMVAVFVLYIVIIFVAIGLGALFAVASSSFPPWLYGTIIFIVVTALIIGVVIVALAVAARIMFIPHAIMIEGLNAGAAIGRSFSLGKGNWYRILGILLFDYFVYGSLSMAMLVPVAIVAYLMGLLEIRDPLEIFRWFSIAWAFIAQVTSILTTPIMAITSTLLYFDSRVRREAYDVELIVRRIAALTPGMPEPMPQPMPVPVMAMAGGFQESWPQMSPLGLSGPAPKPPPPVSAPIVSIPSGMSCPNCNQPLMAGAQFCIACGVRLGD
jgi:hypothetical protein